MNLELRTFFETTLRQELRDLERLRELCVLLAALGIIAAFVAVIMTLYYKGFAILITALPLGIAGWLFFKAYEFWHQYELAFKQNVVESLICFVDTAWEYLPTSKISKDIYGQSGLSNVEIDKYEGGDLIRGKIDDINFECSTLTIEPYPDEDSYDEGIISVNIPLKPKEVFFYADLQKDFSGETFILSTNWWDGISEDDYKVPLIQMGQPDFERTFDVHSNIPTEARATLTPKMMEIMLGLKKKYNTNVRFSFVGSRVYGVIDFEGRLFTPRILRSGVEFDDMVEMYDLIKMIENIIRELSVNMGDLELSDSRISEKIIESNELKRKARE